MSAVTDDLELEDIFSRSQVPEVVVRKDSSCLDADTEATATDANRLSTPAPIASFEVLSDVDDSDMDDVTSQNDVIVDVKSATDDDIDLQTNGLTDDRAHHQCEHDDLPTLVFEDVDANNIQDTAASSPECIVNDDNVNYDDSQQQQQQQQWQWTADQQQGNSSCCSAAPAVRQVNPNVTTLRSGICYGKSVCRLSVCRL